MPGNYILTNKGRYFDLTRPEDHPYDIEEAAHALSHICRYTGHCEKFYSVAQHSVLVSRVLPIAYKGAGLLHDLSEAYYSDVASPLKHIIGRVYKPLELRCERSVALVFGIPFPHPEIVKTADLRMLMTEVRDNLVKPLALQSVDVKWPDYEPYDFTIKPWTPKRAKREFLETYERLFK